MLIEIATFALTDDATEEAFLAADVAVQTEAIPNLPEFVRRTTARGDDGWCVITLWSDTALGRAGTAAVDEHPAGRAFAALVDETSLVRRQYETLD